MNRHQRPQLSPAFWLLAATLSCHESCEKRPGASDGGVTSAPAQSSSASSAASAKPAAKKDDSVNLILPAASVSAFQNPSGVPVYTGPTGSVEGTITVDGDPDPDLGLDFSKCPAARDTYAKLFREGAPLPNGTRPLADALVGVTGYAGFYVPGKSDVRKVTIDKCAFSERTIDMTIGERLEVYNATTILYAPVLAQVTTPAIMLAPPHGDPVKLYPPKPAYYTLLDRVNGAKYMTANVYVLAYPLHATSDLDGHYRIDGIPVGTMDVSARLAAIQKTASTKVDIKEHVVARVDLTLTYHKPANGAPPAAAGDAAAPVNN
jgi:hypothetical protein